MAIKYRGCHRPMNTSTTRARSIFFMAIRSYAMRSTRLNIPCTPYAPFLHGIRMHGGKPFNPIFSTELPIADRFFQFQAIGTPQLAAACGLTATGF